MGLGGSGTREAEAATSPTGPSTTPGGRFFQGTPALGPWELRVCDQEAGSGDQPDTRQHWLPEDT